MPTNQLAVLYRQKVPKIFMFSIMILKSEYRLTILILIKLLKNVNMETGYSTKAFHLKRMNLAYKKWTKTQAKKLKDRGQDWKQSEKKRFKKKKECILREVFYTVGVVFTQQVLYT